LIEKIAYEGLPNCYHVSNEIIELIITTDIGPRVLRFGFVGQQNEFIANRARGFGGHRLWHAPESHPRSYIPDKNPISFEEHNDFVRITQSTEISTNIQKELDIPIFPDKNHISIVHRLYNRGLWPVKLAPWAISVMASGGKAIIPLPKRRSRETAQLIPTSLLAIWEYSDLSDPHLKIGRQYITLRQDKNISQPLKIGVMNTEGWAAYWNNGHLFVKTFEYKNSASYPDLGCSTEVYASNENFELETIAPLKLLPPDESSEYVENWFLFQNVTEPFTDNDIETKILPLLQT